MIRVFACYTQPADEAAFLKHYMDVHAPLVRKMPGLKGFTFHRIDQQLAGQNPFRFQAVLSFDDKAAMGAALGSPEGAAAVADLANFAEGLAHISAAEDLI
jgi:uncharacterized protein (TIGR02118 family)